MPNYVVRANCEFSIVVGGVDSGDEAIELVNDLDVMEYFKKSWAPFEAEETDDDGEITPEDVSQKTSTNKKIKEDSFSLPKPPVGLSPSAVIYELHPGQVEEEFQKIIKAKTGVTVDLDVDYDEETYGIYVRLSYECEENLPEEDYDKVFEAGYNFDEWYEVAVNLFTEFFGTEVRAYAFESTLDESGWMIEVQVPIKP